MYMPSQATPSRLEGVACETDYLPIELLDVLSLIREGRAGPELELDDPGESHWYDLNAGYI